MKETLLNLGAEENNEKKETAEQPELWEKIQQTEAIRFLDVGQETEEEIKNSPELRKLLGEILNHDEGTFEHSLRTADCARAIMHSGNLGFDENGEKTFFIAVLLHDIGKINIDKGILNKTGKLTKEEDDEINKHVTEGIKYLKGKIPEELYGPVALIIGSHHKERDRRGQEGSNNEKDRRKKFGQETKRMARIISIIDEFDSLLYERPYKEAMPINNVQKLLQEEFGQEEDGEIINLLYEYKKLDLDGYNKKQAEVINSSWHRQETETDLGHEPSRYELAQHFIMDKKYSTIFKKRNEHLRTDLN